MEHSFDIRIAKDYGIQPAIMLKHLYFWIEKNRANETNYNDGHYWTYNSKKAFAELFPYMNARQIDYAMKKLIDEGLVITGNYNKVAYDRTLWYAITKKGYCILQNCEMEETKLSNGNNKNVEPIPDINTDVKTDGKPYKDIVEYLNEKSGKSFRAETADTKKHIKARLSEGFTIDDFKSVIDKKCAEWLGTDMEQYLRPQTLFGTKFESYLNAPSKARKGRSGVAIKEPAEDDLAGIL